MAVSDKSSHKLGAQQIKTDQLVFYYAYKKSEQAPIYLQALNQDFVPAGRKMEINAKDFLKKYQPEPKVYLNKVKPALDNINACVDKADQLREKGKLKAAENKYEQALDMDPENVRAVFGLGIVYLTVGDLENAQHLFERLVEVDLAFEPQYKHLFNEFGIRLRKNKMYVQGLEYYRRALQSYRNDENLFFNIGRILYEMENYGDALANVNVALSLNPEFCEAMKLAKVITKKLEEQVAARKTIDLAPGPAKEQNEP